VLYSTESDIRHYNVAYILLITKRGEFKDSKHKNNDKEIQMLIIFSVYNAHMY
jgi:hypothetical protein